MMVESYDSLGKPLLQKKPTLTPSPQLQDHNLSTGQQGRIYNACSFLPSWFAIVQASNKPEKLDSLNKPRDSLTDYGKNGHKIGSGHMMTHLTKVSLSNFQS